jgi:hypothetical protein
MKRPLRGSVPLLGYWPLLFGGVDPASGVSSTSLTFRISTSSEVCWHPLRARCWDSRLLAKSWFSPTKPEAGTEIHRLRTQA